MAFLYGGKGLQVSTSKAGHAARNDKRLPSLSLFLQWAKFIGLRFIDSTLNGSVINSELG